VMKSAMLKLVSRPEGEELLACESTRQQAIDRKLTRAGRPIRRHSRVRCSAYTSR
jgi:hypothetical protein